MLAALLAACGSAASEPASVGGPAGSQNEAIRAAAREYVSSLPGLSDELDAAMRQYVNAHPDLSNEFEVGGVQAGDENLSTVADM